MLGQNHTGHSWSIDDTICAFRIINSNYYNSITAYINNNGQRYFGSGYAHRGTHYKWRHAENEVCRALQTCDLRGTHITKTNWWTVHVQTLILSLIWRYLCVPRLFTNSHNIIYVILHYIWLYDYHIHFTHTCALQNIISLRWIT